MAVLGTPWNLGRICFCLAQLYLCCVGPPSFQTWLTFATNANLLISPLSLSFPFYLPAYALYTPLLSLLCAWALVFLLLSLNSHPACPRSLSFLVMCASFSNAALLLICGMPFSLDLAHSPPAGKEHVCALQEMLSFGWKGLASWQCQNEDPPLLETNKTSLSVELPVSSTESCASQTWGTMPEAHEIIGYTGHVFLMLLKTLGENCSEFFFLIKNCCHIGPRNILEGNIKFTWY